MQFQNIQSLPPGLPRLLQAALEIQGSSPENGTPRGLLLSAPSQACIRLLRQELIRRLEAGDRVVLACPGLAPLPVELAAALTARRDLASLLHQRVRADSVALGGILRRLCRLRAVSLVLEATPNGAPEDEGLFSALEGESFSLYLLEGPHTPITSSWTFRTRKELRLEIPTAQDLQSWLEERDLQSTTTPGELRPFLPGELERLQGLHEEALASKGSLLQLLREDARRTFERLRPPEKLRASFRELAWLHGPWSLRLAAELGLEEACDLGLETGLLRQERESRALFGKDEGPRADFARPVFASLMAEGAGDASGFLRRLLGRQDLVLYHPAPLLQFASLLAGRQSMSGKDFLEDLALLAEHQHELDFRLALRLQEGLASRVERALAENPDEDWLEARVVLLNTKLYTNKRRMHQPELLAEARRMEELARELPRGERNVLRALLHQGRHYGASGRPFPEDLRRRALQWVRLHPALERSQTWRMLIGDQALLGWTRRDTAMSDWAAGAMESCLEQSGLSEEDALDLRRRVEPFLLYRYSSEEEVSHCLRQVPRIDALYGDKDLTWLTIRQILWIQLGEFGSALEHAGDLGRRLREAGLWRNLVTHDSHTLLLHFLATDLGPHLDDWVEGLLLQEPHNRTDLTWPALRFHHALSRLLAGDDEHCLRLLREVESETPRYPLARLCLLLLEGRAGTLLQEKDQRAWYHLRHWHGIWELVAEQARGASCDNEALARLARSPLLDLFDLFRLPLLLCLCRRRNTKPPACLREALQRQLLWYEQRGAAQGMQMLLDAWGGLLEAGALKQWRERTLLLREPIESAAGNVIQIQMLDRIRLQMPDGSERSPRGSRLRRLLGLLVAARLLRQPMSREEFTLLLAGEEPRERMHNIQSISLHRLRELLGPRALESVDDLPRLHPELVRCDLDEAWQALREAERQEHEPSLVGAVRAARRALEELAGKELFPGLYHRFFEALRDDAAARLRGITLRLGHRLLLEKDAERAAELGSLLFEHTPDDPDLAEFLAEAWTAAGQPLAAERARIRHQLALEQSPKE